MCNCLEAVNAALAKHNTRIMLPIMLTMVESKRTFVGTQKIDESKRGKPMMVFATCCPFCRAAARNVIALGKWPPWRLLPMRKLALGPRRFARRSSRSRCLPGPRILVAGIFRMTGR